MYTFVSGLETLYVAGCVILLHSHLLPQRFGSHPIDNAIANLQWRIHAHYQWEFMLVHVISTVSVSPGYTCLACCLRLSFTDSRSTFFHSAAIQRKTSAPPFSTWWHAQFHYIFTFLLMVVKYFLALHCACTPLTCRRRWSMERWANTLNSSWE